MKKIVLDVLENLQVNSISNASVSQTIDRIKSISRDSNVYKYIKYAVNTRTDWKGVFDNTIRKYEEFHDIYMKDSDLDNLAVGAKCSSIEIGAFANSYNINHGMILFRYNGQDRLIVKATLKEKDGYDNRWASKNVEIKYHLQNPPRNGSYSSHKVNVALLYSLSEGIDIPVYVFTRDYRGQFYTFNGLFSPISYDGEGYVYLKNDQSISLLDVVKQEKESKNLFQSEVGQYTEQRTKRRLGQGIFRKALLNTYDRCSICGFTGKEFLFASHIKPYSECKKQEHVDVNNGLLLCPVHDFLFDKYLLTINIETGELLPSLRLLESDFDESFYKGKIGLEINPEMKEYLRHHNKRFHDIDKERTAHK